jgi:anti-sigma-K factor RskA
MAVPPVQPPPAMKASLMALIASTPQLPREDAPVRPLSAVVSDPILPNEIAPDETALDAPETIAPPAPAIELNAKAQARWFTRPIVALTAVAAAVALIVGGGIVANVLGDTSFNQQQADQLAAINAAEDSQRAVAEVSTGGTATLVWSEELGKSALIAEGLEPLPSDKTYELWYINPDGTPTSAGLFSASADDAKSWRVLDGQMQAGDIVGVTIEPRGGSEAPTTTPIVAITSA